MYDYSYLKVFYNGSLVGALTRTPEKLITFEYDSEWLEKGFSISPLSLPLKKEVFVPEYNPFIGLFGVFNDSFPDGFGKMIELILVKQKKNPPEINNLNRLAVTKENVIGALTYKTESGFLEPEAEELAQECSKILQPEYNNLDELAELYGHKMGARYKAYTKINGEDWIIKLPLLFDSKNCGEKEYKYSLCAKNCGIKTCDTKLFDSKVCPGYFGVKRFDRGVNGHKIHAISVSGLLEKSHRLHNHVDYNVLMQLTWDLTKSYNDVEQMYRLMCFNVFSYNRDDNIKNFSFIYDDIKKEWHLAPAYDLTFSVSFKGQHTSTVNGKNIDITTEDILAVGINNGMNENAAKEIAFEIKDKCAVLTGQNYT